MDPLREQGSTENSENYGDLLRSMSAEGKALIEQYKELLVLEAKRFFTELKESLILAVVGGVSSLFGAFFLVLGLCQGLARGLNLEPWVVYLSVGIAVVAIGLACLKSAMNKAPTRKKKIQSNLKQNYGLPN